MEEAKVEGMAGQTDGAADDVGSIFVGLAELPPKAILDEAALAKIFGLTPRSIRRAVSRQELPPPVKFSGRSVWISGKILEHIASRLDDRAESAGREQKRIARLLA